MTLYEYLKSRPSSAEVTVYDKDYDTEVYFYNDIPDDKWDMTMEDLSKLVLVTKIIMDDVVECDFTGLIEQKLDDIKDTNLFTNNTVNGIMGCLHRIISGDVSDVWLQKFVEVLK